MTYDDIASMINSTRIENAYYQYPEGEAPELPYILFYYPQRDDFQADDKNYAKVPQLNIELYTDRKDPEIEADVEAVLSNHDLFYDKSEVWIESEKMYEVLYQVRIIYG